MTYVADIKLDKAVKELHVSLNIDLVDSLHIVIS